MGYEITEEKREIYRRTSVISARAKAKALAGEGPSPVHPVYTPRLDACTLMPPRLDHGLRALSLFSGGGGLDLGFERAGFAHVASYDIIPVCGETLSLNRPAWQVYAGETGNVTKARWEQYADMVDVIHGGPPCQPFSIAGKQRGAEDERNMWPEFVRCVLTLKPQAFISENVTGLLDPKFSGYVNDEILTPLKSYRVFQFKLHAAMFGVPQSRQRVFFVGFRDQMAADRFTAPQPTHRYDHFGSSGRKSVGQLGFFDDEYTLIRCMGVREALGLPDIGVDGLAPTLRSGFTGPRNSTSVLNSVASQRIWQDLQIWPNGVAESREKASIFVAKYDHFRMSIQDCALIQGFPVSWRFAGGVYKTLGQIGNSVAPPVAYAVARAVSKALLG